MIRKKTKEIIIKVELNNIKDVEIEEVSLTYEFGLLKTEIRNEMVQR